MQKLRIFTASPSDMAVGRAKVQMVAAMLKPLADNLGIVLDVVDWRSAVSDMGRPEQVILDQLKPTEWDVLIGMLWHRFGTPPGGKDPQTGKEYLSGTEEEFRTAYRLWKGHGKPRIMMYRCLRAIPPDTLDPDQYKRVKEFFNQFDAVRGEHPGLYQSFETTEALEKLLLDNLQRLLLDYGEHLRGKPVEPALVKAFAPKIPDNLPRRAPFFGRDKEIGTVLHALSPADRTWGVLVDGIGGIGKTALAAEAAYHCKEKRLFDAFIFVSAKQNILAPGGIRPLTPAAHTLDEFLNETARVLGQTGIPQLAGDEKRRALLDALRGTRALLIYDNLETLAKEEQEALADFLRELPPGCKAIITSRRRGGEGAVWLRLEKLEWDAARKIIEEEGKKDARLAGKLGRAGDARWQELYDEKKGSPLALVHVLGLLRVRTALTFDDALAMMRGSRAPDLQRFIFQEAHRELTINDQAALRALSFFAPSAAFEAWMEVAELSRNTLETTVDRLSALSLVDVLAGEERYALHPLTRNFVRDELLADANMAYGMGTRFAEYWVRYAQRYGGMAENYQTFNLLRAEWANLAAAAEWLWQTAAVQGERVGNKEAAQNLDGLARALWSFLDLDGRWDEEIQLVARAYEAMHVLKNYYQAGWHAHLVARIHIKRSQIADAQLWVSTCVDASTRGGDKSIQTIGTSMLGEIAELHGEYDKAEKLYQEALEVWRQWGLPGNIATVLHKLGRLAGRRGDYDEAGKYFLEELEMDKKSGQMDQEAVTYGDLGDLALARQRWPEGRKRFEEQLALAEKVGALESVANAQYGLARVLEAEGRPDRALPLAQQGLQIYERLHHSRLRDANELVDRLRNTAGRQ